MVLDRTISRITLVTTLWLGAGLFVLVDARQERASEYQVKAAFLYNFAKFVEWPSNAFSDPDAPVVLGVVGEDPFGQQLDQTVNGKTVNGRVLVVRRLQAGQDLRSCHVLFISASERKRVPQILQSLNGASVLTVSEAGDFAEHGGVISFFIEDNRVRFEIAPANAGRARLRISSKLLQLARLAKR